MVTTILQLVAIVAVVVGTLFSVVGVLGLIRMPDVYSRLHAAGKVGVFGVVLLLVAAAASSPVSLLESVALILFLLVAGPVTTHAIASAAYRVGVPMKAGLRDDLAAVSPPTTDSAPAGTSRPLE